jgi:hypothetical protein
MISMMDRRAPPPKALSSWEKFDITLKALVPISIAIVGWFINHNLAVGNRQAEDARSAQLEKQASDTGRREALVVLPDFMDSLSGRDPRRKELAMATIRLLLPDDAPALLSIVADDTSQPDEIREQANDLAIQGAKDLIERMFDPDSRSVRTSALASLTRGGVAPSLLIPALLDRGSRDVSNKPGTINTLTLLGILQPSDLKPFEEQIRTYAKAAWGNGTQTEGLVDRLLGRL